jgi:pyruvate dehydrogenase E1 component alpha subunit
LVERIAGSSIRHTAMLGADGRLLGPLPEWCTDMAVLTGLYRWMVLTRTFDAAAIALHRTGRVGTYASSLGQEAVSTGVGHAMHADDVLLPSFREHGAQLVRGALPRELLPYWGGDERGSNFSATACRQDFPVSVTVGGHAPMPRVWRWHRVAR